MKELHQLLPEEEPEWWKSAVNKHRVLNASSTNNNTSGLPGWTEVVDQKSGTVSMQRVRGGTDRCRHVRWPTRGPLRQLSACKPPSKVLVVAGHLRGGLGEAGSLVAQAHDWGAGSLGAQPHKWDDSAERRLNVPDSDMSVEIHHHSLPMLTPPPPLRVSASGSRCDASCSAKAAQVQEIMHEIEAAQVPEIMAANGGAVMGSEVVLACLHWACGMLHPSEREHTRLCRHSICTC